MTAQTIRKLVNAFTQAGLYDYLVFYGGNGSMNRFYINNNTSTTILDYDNEQIISFRTNNNPIRSSAGERMFEVITMDFESLDGVYVLVDDKEAKTITESLGFDMEKVKKVILDRSGISSATGFQQKEIFDEDGKLKTEYKMPKTENGLPVLRYK